MTYHHLCHLGQANADTRWEGYTRIEIPEDKDHWGHRGDWPPVGAAAIFV